ncbi:MAG: YceI family protein [Acidimicrobiales bacterium]
MGYRVNEVLVGQSTTAVGRTKKVWGSAVVQGAKVTSGTFTVDMATVVSDQPNRNAQFDGRIMNVAQYPTASLRLSAPVVFSSVPALGVVTTVKAEGALTMHGVTKSISFTVSVERTSSTLDVLADIPILFSDWDIANPSVGGIVTTADHGTLEALLVLTKGTGNPVSTEGAGSGGFGGSQITVPSTTVPPLKLKSSS